MTRRIGAIHWKKFEKFLFSQGCIFKREKGDHRIYWKLGMRRPVIIPRDNELPPGIILNNLKTLGCSRADYLDFLNDIE